MRDATTVGLDQMTYEAAVRFREQIAFDLSHLEKNLAGVSESMVRQRRGLERRPDNPAILQEISCLDRKKTRINSSIKTNQQILARIDATLAYGQAGQSGAVAQ